MITADYISKCPPMDVCLNKPSKMRYLAQMNKEKHDQSRQHLVDWVEEAYNNISYGY